ncbi:MAG: DUF456 family protein [Spirulina sp. SIO3F2]|nr:DUF456 family protein [Spirulina sp. SIO3F2]
MMLLYLLLVGVMLAGAIGEMIPGMPGVTLVLGGVLVWTVVTGFAGINLPLLVVLALLVVSSAIEALAFYWGAKKLGASRWGQVGAVIGLIVGFLGLLPALPVGGPILGALLGPFVGAFVGEFLHVHELPLKQRCRTALKASLGTVVGAIIGNLVDGAIAVLAVIIFVASTWPLVVLVS